MNRRVCGSICFTTGLGVLSTAKADDAHGATSGPPRGDIDDLVTSSRCLDGRID